MLSEKKEESNHRERKQALPKQHSISKTWGQMQAIMWDNV